MLGEKVWLTVYKFILKVFDVVMVGVLWRPLKVLYNKLVLFKAAQLCWSRKGPFSNC